MKRTSQRPARRDDISGSSFFAKTSLTPCGAQLHNGNRSHSPQCRQWGLEVFSYLYGVKHPSEPHVLGDLHNDIDVMLGTAVKSCGVSSPVQSTTGHRQCRIQLRVVTTRIRRR